MGGRRRQTLADYARGRGKECKGTGPMIESAKRPEKGGLQWRQVSAAKLVNDLARMELRLKYELRTGISENAAVAQVEVELLDRILMDIIEGKYDKRPRKRSGSKR